MPDGSLSSEGERWWGRGDGNNWMGCNDGGGGGGIRIVTILPIETSRGVCDTRH